MCRNHRHKLKVAVAAVDEAVAAAHRAVVHLSRQQLLFASIGNHSGLTLEEIHDFAIGVVAVVAYRGPWRECAKHDFVVLVNKSVRHILTLTALEISGDVESQFFKVNYHSSIMIVHYALCVNQGAAQLCIMHCALCII